MKPAKELIYTLIAISILVCRCYPVDVSIPSTISDKIIKNPFNINAGFTGKPIDFADGNAVCFANKTSCNLADNVRFLLQAVSVLQQHQNLNDHFEFIDGIFELYDDRYQSYLTGTFKGNGFNSSTGFKIYGIVDIDSGTGIFEANSGVLRVVISGHINPENKDSMNYSILIGGFFGFNTETSSNDYN